MLSRWLSLGFFSATLAWISEVVYKKKPSLEDDLELVQIHVITRHGARTPLIPSSGAVDDMFHGMPPYNWECESFEVTDPSLHLLPEGKEEISYDNYKKHSLHSYDKPKAFGSCVDAQLTLEGMKQSLEFGQLLRLRYVDAAKFLPSIYNPDNFWIRSSNTSRTILTARQVMRGLYPQEFRPSETKVILNIAAEETLYPCSTCERFNSLKRKKRKEQAPLLASTRELLSKSENPYWHNRTSISSVTNNLNAFVDHSFPLPRGITEQDFNKILSISGEQFQRTYSNDELQRLAIGRFIGEVTQNIEKAITSPNNAPKVIMYSGHDTTLGPLLVSLGAFDGKHPRMGSAVIIELLKHDKNYYLRLFFYDPVQKLKLIKMESCSLVCPVQEYFSLVENKIPKNFIQECQKEPSR